MYIHTSVDLTCDTPIGVNDALRDLNGLARGIDHAPRIRVDSVAISDADTSAAAVTYDKYNARVRFGYGRESETRRNAVNANKPYANGEGSLYAMVSSCDSKEFRVKNTIKINTKNSFAHCFFSKTATPVSFD